MMNSVQLKELVEKVGSTDEFSVFRLRLRGIEKNPTKISTLWYAYKIAKYTSIFTPDVHRFIFEQPISYAELSYIYGISTGNLKNRIHRQTRKYADIIGCDLYQEIRNNTISTESCALLLEDLQRFYDKQEKIQEMVEDHFYEDIITGRTLETGFEDVDDTDYTFARDIFARFSRPANNYLMENLDDHLKDYIVYLLTTPETRMTSKDKLRKENLLRFLHLA